jgi:hypothetical protein
MMLIPYNPIPRTALIMVVAKVRLVFVLAAWQVEPRMNQRVFSMEANFASDSIERGLLLRYFQGRLVLAEEGR